MINFRIAKSIKCNGDCSIFITFNYNPEIVTTIKELCQERFYNKDRREWEVPYKYMDELYTNLKIIDMVNVIEEFIPEVKTHVELPPTFQYKTEPYKHQKVGVDYGLQLDRWLLGDEQGLGKTKQVIDIAVARKQLYGYKHCLIVCGVNSLKWNWRNEVYTHSNEEAHILGQRYLKNGKLVVKGSKEKIEDLDLLLENDLNSYFIITNVESLRNDEIVSRIVNLTAQNSIQMIAVDEIHKTKDAQSQQAKGLLKIHADCEIAMTGTPLMNTPLDLYIIFKWLGYEKHSFYQFRNHHCVMGGFGGYEIIGYKNLDELEDRLKDIMLRRRKEEVLDLPEKTYVDEYVDMTPKQKLIYDEVTAAIKMNIDQISIAPNPLAELIRMRQATGYTGILSSTIQESAKLDRMEEIVDDAISNGRKVVIFSNWTQITDVTYARLCGKYKVGLITGETKDSDRQDIVLKFQDTEINAMLHDRPYDGLDVIIGTVGAMGTGLNLYSGSVIIFLDHPWTRAAYDQAVDRCHRIGQINNITIYNLMCRNTIDEKIWILVKEKGELSDAIIDSRINRNKLELLEYLLS